MSEQSVPNNKSDQSPGRLEKLGGKYLFVQEMCVLYLISKWSSAFC